MKHIHLPTLFMHIALLVLARFTLSDYPGLFLGTAVLVLIFHAAWAIKSGRNFLIAHCMGICLYRLSQMLGLIQIDTGFWGMGSEFAWFFYGIALAISFVVHSIIRLHRWRKARNQRPVSIPTE